MALSALPSIPPMRATSVLAEVSPTAGVAGGLLLVVVIFAVIAVRRRSSPPPMTRLGAMAPVGDAELADFLVDSVPRSLQDATDLTRATPAAADTVDAPADPADPSVEPSEPTD